MNFHTDYKLINHISAKIINPKHYLIQLLSSTNVRYFLLLQVILRKCYLNISGLHKVREVLMELAS